MGLKLLGNALLGCAAGAAIAFGFSDTLPFWEVATLAALAGIVCGSI